MIAEHREHRAWVRRALDAARERARRDVRVRARLKPQVPQVPQAPQAPQAPQVWLELPERLAPARERVPRA